MNPTTPGPQDRLLTQLAMVPACQTPNDGADWFPPVDIVEDADEDLFKIDLPEVNPENLEVAVEEDALVIVENVPAPGRVSASSCASNVLTATLRVDSPSRMTPTPGRSTRSFPRVFSKCACARSLPVRRPAPTNTPPRLRLRSAA